MRGDDLVTVAAHAADAASRLAEVSARFLCLVAAGCDHSGKAESSSLFSLVLGEVASARVTTAADYNAARRAAEPLG